MTDITIPREALIAGANVAATARAKTWEGVAEQVFLAMLKAWPGMFPQVGYHGMEIILPLTQENNNEKV